MRKILFFAFLLSCATSFAQPSVSATTKWQVYDGNSTWVPSALDLRTYCLAGAGVIPTGGTAGQVLSKIDGTNYNTQWITSGGSGDIINGGNTTGATVVIGTNDANSLDFETNGVTRLSITGGASTGGAFTATDVTANTNTVTSHNWIANSSGTAAAGLGLRHVFQLESTTTNAQDAGAIGAIWTTATHASRTSAVVNYAVMSAAALGEISRFEAAATPTLKIASAVGTPGTTSYFNSGITPQLAYTIGTGSNNVTVGNGSGTYTLGGASTTSVRVTGGSGDVLITSANANNPPLLLDATSTGSTWGVTVGQTSYSLTTLAKTSMSTRNTYTASTGGGVLTGITVGDTYNLTSAANGAQKGVEIKPVLTALAASSYAGVVYNPSFTAASGSGATKGFEYSPTLNLTSTQSGVQKAIDINPTLTSLVGVGSFIAVDMPVNNTKAIAINQTGASTPNYLVGQTTVGSTTADASAALAVVSTTKGFLLPRMTSAQKEAISSPTDGLEVWDTDLDGKCVYDGVKWVRLSQRSAPSVSVGAGAGTGASATITGNDIQGIVTLTTGTSPTTSATLFTVTWFDSYTTAPTSVIMTGNSSNAINLPGGRIPYVSSVGTTTFVATNAATNGLLDTTVYIFNYETVQ